MSLSTVLHLALALGAAAARVDGTFLDKRQCPGTLTPAYAAPVLSQGWTAQLIANGLGKARALVFDSSGALLVAQADAGVTRLTFTEDGGCVRVASNTSVLLNNQLSHGLALSAEGTTLYASTAEAVLAWAYDPGTGTVSGAPTTVIDGMNSTAHISRTLILSRARPGHLLVSRGSNDNVDLGTRDLASGRSMVKAFDLAALPAGRPYNYTTEGRVMGWGLRNDVGVAEHPVTGGVFAVENSQDDLTRDGVDVHNDNPGEELNYLGALSDPVPERPPNYGYPDCFAIYNTSGVPNSQNLRTGDQFSQNQTTTMNDSICARDFVAPRITFQAHTAPMDIVFTPDGSEALISFRGSWNREPPIGYNIGVVKFDNCTGQPVEPPTSTTALIDIMTNPNITACPDGCFRPVGLALDAKGRLFTGSDASGEIYVLQRSAA